MSIPSAGCRTCKIRRIKCDEGRPSCYKCIKSGRICRGTTDRETGVVVLSENSYASGRKKRPRGPRPAKHIQQDISSKPAPCRPIVDLNTTALLYYMHHHMQIPRDAPEVVTGVANYLMPAWQSRAGVPIVELAFSSLALAIFSRTQQHRPAAIEATVKYQELLQVARVKTPSVKGQSFDDFLLATIFMSRFENSMYTLGSPGLNPPCHFGLPSYSHADGTLAILKIWKEQTITDMQPSNIVKHARRGAIRSCLLRGHAIPDWMTDGTIFGEHGLDLEYDGLVVQIANLRQRLEGISQDKITPQVRLAGSISTLQMLGREAKEVDEALNNWSKRFPEKWRYERHTLTDPHIWPIREFYSPAVHTYSNPTYAAVWSQYFATRMLVNSALLRVLDLLYPVSDFFAHQQRLECTSRLKDMSDGLAANLPFCLERLKLIKDFTSSRESSITVDTREDIKPYLATLVVWPLTIASFLRNLDLHQKGWFASQLARIGKIVGDKVLESAEDNPFLEM